MYAHVHIAIVTTSKYMLMHIWYHKLSDIPYIQVMYNLNSIVDSNFNSIMSGINCPLDPHLNHINLTLLTYHIGWVLGHLGMENMPQLILGVELESLQ